MKLSLSVIKELLELAETHHINISHKLVYSNYIDDKDSFLTPSLNDLIYEAKRSLLIESNFEYVSFGVNLFCEWGGTAIEYFSVFPNDRYGYYFIPNQEYALVVFLKSPLNHKDVQIDDLWITNKDYGGDNDFISVPCYKKKHEQPETLIFNKVLGLHDDSLYIYRREA